MTNSGNWTAEGFPSELPHHQKVLDGTDWASLATVCGTGESLPSALVRLLDLDPSVRAGAVKDALAEVTHQNSIYEATVPVALYVAAVLNHPATAAGEDDHVLHPTREQLLDWLAYTAYDADDECVAMGRQYFGEGFLDACPHMRAFRHLRPEIYCAVQPLLTDGNASVRDAALVAAIPLTEHPALTERRNELAHHATRLLGTSTDRFRRDRVLEALQAWGHDTSALENADDITARELRARLADPDYWWANNGTGASAEDPPF
ncbi:hypothetical protein ACFU6S_02090 [Streptomyces sp. NPDC057456]|uniref:hypothetical protein n=1 Tax=Streptomyces sp. NPDC057456 TaxID=3346139 RepID=UPI003684BA5F